MGDSDVLGTQRDAGPEFSVRPQGDGLLAENFQHGFAAAFAREGFELRSTGAYPWRAVVSVQGFGCPDDIADVEAAVPHTAGSHPMLVEQDHGTVRAWYLNGPLGLEQGFDISTPPACATTTGHLSLAMTVTGLTPRLRSSRNIELVDNQDTAILSFHGLRVADAHGVDVSAALRVEGDRIVVDVDAHDAAYPITIDPLWSQLTKLYGSEAVPTGAGAVFGHAVALEGDMAVVGAPHDNEVIWNSGAAYIFKRNGAAWVKQAKLKGQSTSGSGNYGVSVSTSNNTVLVGAPGSYIPYQFGGAAEVWVWSGTMWSRQALLLPGDNGGKWFGERVSLSEDTAIVSHRATFAFPYPTVYVYHRSGTTWTQQAHLIPSEPSGQASFGVGLAVSGDTAIVSAATDQHGGPGTGAAYIFQRNGTTWSEQAKLIASDAAPEDQFGPSVAISGDYAAVGAISAGSNGSPIGWVYIFARSGSSWTQQAKLTASDTVAGDQFGTKISLTEDTVAVGAYGNNDAGAESGAAYLFRRVGTTWSQLDKLTISDGAAGDQFGAAVAVSGSRVIVGARYAEDLVAYAGTAYLFVAPTVPCTMDGECATGFCRDGVCCDTDCGGGLGSDCQVCDLPGAEGFCSPRPAATVCRAGSGDSCDPDETCNGASMVCPTDVVAAATTVCRVGSGDGCDPDETCTGVAGDACPTDVVEPSTTICRAQSDFCDAAELCSGVLGEACPADVVQPADFVCRAAMGDCDVAELCDAVNPSCPIDALAADGTSCDSGMGMCQMGSCEALGSGGGAGAGGTGAGGMGATGVGGGVGGAEGGAGGTPPNTDEPVLISQPTCSSTPVGRTSTGAQLSWLAYLAVALGARRRRTRSKLTASRRSP